MLVIHPDSAGKVVGVKAVGKLTDADYEDAVPKLEAVIEAEGAIRVLADLTEFEGWEWAAAWDDFAFGIKHWNHIERMAIVGDERWQTLAARIADKLMKADVKVFAAGEADDAWEWIRG